ncbi:MAG: ribbon-helix-helix protein, CopG family [Burkholderiaceae bacterium]|nr:ribbon-helix-helix protein, CopG family [Burkholderiaceae bacterium]
MKRSGSGEPRRKFSSRAPDDVLASLQRLARADGRTVQAVLEEALRRYVEQREAGQPRRHVMRALNDSLGEFDSLYRGLPR